MGVKKRLRLVKASVGHPPFFVLVGALPPICDSGRRRHIGTQEASGRSSDKSRRRGGTTSARDIKFCRRSSSVEGELSNQKRLKLHARLKNAKSFLTTQMRSKKNRSRRISS